jgi:bis(5'-nucleosyl)-tetraphosphatase (symmetrical)
LSGSTWIVGDVHGCPRTLSRLLERADVDLDRDRLFLVGDLVNRGRASLTVLRWAVETSRRCGARFDCVLGNHDLHLLALAREVAVARPSDRLGRVLGAPDREQLLGWLRERPLALRVDETLVVHAGVEPHWTLDDTLERAGRASAALRGPLADSLLRREPTAGSQPDDEAAASSTIADLEAIRADLSILTRVRMFDQAGEPSAFSGPPNEAPPGLTPWYAMPGRRTAEGTVVFGHWAALGLHVAPGLFGLDSGCAWGRRLTALRLEDGLVVQQRVARSERPNLSP